MNSKIKRVQFYKGDNDPFGMPADYQSYLIRARIANHGETATPGSGIAKVYALSLQAIPLNPDNVVDAGGIDGAIEKAIERLKSAHNDYTFRQFDGE
jgi:hypothetical protein